MDNPHTKTIANVFPKFYSEYLLRYLVRVGCGSTFSGVLSLGLNKNSEKLTTIGL